MTDLSFNNYISRARENLDGTVRIAKGDDSQLINHKGSFGNGRDLLQEHRLGIRLH